MVCEEKGQPVMVLARYEKEILGVKTDYILEKQADESYRITVRRRNEIGVMLVGGDFLQSSMLFGLVVDSDTLPENIDDIQSDLRQEYFL